MPVGGRKKDGADPPKRRSAHEILRQFRAKYGERVGAIGERVSPPPRIPTGVLEFDIASGGGFPAGNMSIVWGDKDCTKSTLVYKTIATYQQQHPGKVVAFGDLETNYDSDYGEQIGVDEDRLLRLLPDCAEDAGDMVLELIEGAEDVGLICLDSLATLVPKREQDRDLADGNAVGATGLFVSQFLKKTANRLLVAMKRGDAPTVLYINQVRSKIGAMGDPSTMPGGRAPEFYASTIVRLYSGKDVVLGEHGDRPVRKYVKGVIQKKKGPIVCRNFEYEMAVVPHGGLRPGETDDWSMARVYLEEGGQLGKLEGGRAWQILEHEFPTRKACQAWYNEHKDEARQAIVSRLLENPDEV